MHTTAENRIADLNAQLERLTATLEAQDNELASLIDDKVRFTSYAYGALGGTTFLQNRHRDCFNLWTEQLPERDQPADGLRHGFER